MPSERAISLKDTTQDEITSGLRTSYSHNINIVHISTLEIMLLAHAAGAFKNLEQFKNTWYGVPGRLRELLAAAAPPYVVFPG